MLQDVSCPIFREKNSLDILNVEKNIGVSLTESLAMYQRGIILQTLVQNILDRKVQKIQTGLCTDRKNILKMRWLKPNLNF